MIHHCCQIGNIQELQKFLDRRKFAVAREDKTGYKMSPLHVAVLFNEIGAARYLAGRFPETLQQKDALGRTPLHYAAMHPDRSLNRTFLKPENVATK